MDKTVKALVGLLVAGLVLSLGLAFSGIGVEREGEIAEPEPISVEQIEATIQQSCIACHGADLTGGPAAPSLHNLDEKYDQSDIANILTNGKGAMPKGLVPGLENDVAEYLLTLE